MSGKSSNSRIARLQRAGERIELGSQDGVQGAGGATGREQRRAAPQGGSSGGGRIAQPRKAGERIELGSQDGAQGAGGAFVWPRGGGTREGAATTAKLRGHGGQASGSNSDSKMGLQEAGGTFLWHRGVFACVIDGVRS